MDTDTKIAGAIAGLYLMLCVALLPATEYLRALGGGLFVFGVITVIARQMGRGPFPGMSILVVAFASAVVLAIPTFPAMGGMHSVAIPLGFLGVQASVLLWAAIRWTPLPPAASHVSLVTAWGMGLLGAIGLSAVATVPIVLILISGDEAGSRILWVYPGYVVGLLSAATVYWLLQRISHLATGRYLIGFLGGSCVYGAIAPVVALLENEPMDPAMMLIVALVAGGLIGPALALDTTSKGLGSGI